MMGFWDAAASDRQLQLWQFLAGYPPNFVFLLCACSSVVAMWKINSLSLSLQHLVTQFLQAGSSS